MPPISRSWKIAKSHEPVDNAHMSASALPSAWRMLLPGLVLVIQTIAAAFFLVDGIDDLIAQAQSGINGEVLLECLVATALVGGVIVGGLHLRSMVNELVRKDSALAKARGALTEHVSLRFSDWELTRGESEVALFALKGCDVADIARLRGAAAGTVRSQLSQIYAKAGVSSQAMFVSLFIEDLLDPATTS